MPFKSKSQQGFMFAAEARGDLPKGTAKRWADHTKNIKDLPEHVKKTKQKKEAHLKLAFLLGQQLAMEEAGVKKAAVGESLISGMLRGSAHLWGPAALGATLAGPDYRTEGALAGLGFGALGKGLGRSMLRNSKFAPEELANLAKVEGLKPGTSAFKEFAEANKDLAGKYDEYMRGIGPAEWAGRLAGAGTAGMLLPKIMGPKGNYGYPSQRMEYQQPQFMSPPLPAVSDISGHYSGILPEGMTY